MGNRVIYIPTNDVEKPQQRCVLYFGNQRSVIYERIYEEYEWLGTGSGSPNIRLQRGYNTDENAFIETTYKCQYSSAGFDIDIGLNNSIDGNQGIRIFNYGGSATYIDVHKNMNGEHQSKRIIVYGGQAGTPRYVYASLTQYKVDNTSGAVTLGDAFDSTLNYGATLMLTNQNYNDVWYKETKLRVNNVNYDLVPCKLLQSIPAILDGNGIARQAGECGMWDKVSNRFYGNVANSGTFTVKNPKCYEVYKWLKGGIPQGTSMMYLPIGTYNVSYNVKYDRLANTTLFDIDNGYRYYNAGKFHKTAVWDLNNNVEVIRFNSNTFATDTIIPIVGNAETLYINNQEVTKYGNAISNVVFRSGKNDGNTISYTSSIIADGSVRYVPCKLLQSIPASMDANGIARQSGTCGMWDKINDVFYGNVASSGSFSVSND